MGLKYAAFPVHGIDVSSYNGSIDWSKVWADFTAIRVGYGRVIDKKFRANWQNAKGKVYRIPYWYMDYYSNHTADSPANGISDTEWDKIQADFCWNAIKNDPEGMVFLDIESGGSSYAPAITTVTNRGLTIAKSFLQRIDKLTGRVNGIYCSLHLLSWFTSWFRNRPLWLAWYNEKQTTQSVLEAVKKKNWAGKCYIWQYASDGDLDDDGEADGIKMGMAFKYLDLNAWLGTTGEYADFIGKEAEVELYKVKILIYNLLIRTGPGLTFSVVRRADFPGEYSIYEEQNNYGRISTTKSEWISLSPDYVQKLEPVKEPTDAEKLAKLWAAHPELH